MSWRFLATRLHGDGTETLVADELPVSSPSLTRALSGAGGITGTIAPEVARLKGSRAAAEAAMAAATGATRFYYGDAEPVGDVGGLWVGPGLTPYLYVPVPGQVVDGGPADTTHDVAADGDTPTAVADLILDGGAP